MDRQYYLDCLNESKKLYVEMLGKARGLKVHLNGEIEYLISEPHGGAEYIFNFNISADRVCDCIEELRIKIKEQKMPGYILFSPLAKPENLVEVLKSKGFCVNVNEGSGMAMDLNESVNTLKIPESIKVLTVADKETLEDWAEIVNKALFEGNLFSFEQIQDMYALENTVFFIGLFEGVPVSTSIVIMSKSGEFAEVEWISTLEEYRNRGAGTAMTVASIQHAYIRGAKTAVLHARASAENLYKKVGFAAYYNCIEAFLNEKI